MARSDISYSQSSGSRQVDVSFVNASFSVNPLSFIKYRLYLESNKKVDLKGLFQKFANCPQGRPASS